MEDIIIVSPGRLPVPAVCGGAVETLIQLLIDKNEENPKYRITVFSIYDKDAEKRAILYKYCKFIFIDDKSLLYRSSKIFRYCINRIPNVYIGSKYIYEVYKKIKCEKMNYKYIIIENEPIYGFFLKKHFSKLILHLHNDYLHLNVKLSKRILNSYDKILSLSNFISGRIREIDNQYKNIFTLYNGIQNEKFSNVDKYYYRDNMNIDNEDFVFLYTGRIVKEKGVLELIKAFKIASTAYHKIKLYIAGDISSKNKYIKMLLKESKSNNNIKFLGKINYENMPKIYSIADIGVIPSVWEEPFALTVIEHMASGNPVIISNSGAMPELVNEKCSIIAEKNENYIENLSRAIIYMVENYSKFNLENVRKQAEVFNSTVYFDTFVELVEKNSKNKEEE